MSHESKKSTLAKLAASNNEKSQGVLDGECRKIATTFQESKDFLDIQSALELLEEFVFRVPDEGLDDLVKLINRLDGFEPDLPSDYEAEGFAAYYSAAQLQKKAIEVLSRLRFLKTLEVTRVLISLSTREEKIVREASESELERLAEFDGDVLREIGARPQMQILEVISSLSDEELEASIEALKKILGRLLKFQTETHHWTAESLKIGFGSIPPTDQFKKVRSESVQLVKKLFAKQTEDRPKREILNAMMQVRSYHSRGDLSDDSKDMITENIVEVLDFLKGLIETESLPIVQMIEHDSYWTFHHALNDEVATKALEIESQISLNAEYQIFRDLIGFEGVHGVWSEERTSDVDFRAVEEKRKKRAKEYAHSITPENYEEWRNRIVRFSQSDSEDLAYFIVFFEFLSCFAAKSPNLALQLVKEKSHEIEPILISLLRSLWDTDLRPELLGLMESWIGSGIHLFAMTKMFIDNSNVDLEVLAKVRDRAIEQEELSTLYMLITVAASNFPRQMPSLIQECFLRPIEFLSDRFDASWVYGIWYRSELFDLLDALDPKEVDAVLQNLLFLKEIDYHSERILTPIAKRFPIEVVRVFKKRLAIRYDDDVTKPGNYGAIPFDLHDLREPLAEAVRAVIPEIRSWYDGDYGEFFYKGADLPHIIFPEFGKEFQDELLAILEKGQKEDLEFVTLVLRQYSGEPFIYDMCKRVVQLVEEDDELVGEVHSAMWNTPVVSGVYGLADAYQEKAELVRPWLEDGDKKVRNFASKFVTSMEKNSEHQRQQADQEVEYRKLKYGE